MTVPRTKTGMKRPRRPLLSSTAAAPWVNKSATEHHPPGFPSKKSWPESGPKKQADDAQQALDSTHRMVDSLRLHNRLVTGSEGTLHGHGVAHSQASRRALHCHPTHGLGDFVHRCIPNVCDLPQRKQQWCSFHSLRGFGCSPVAFGLGQREGRVMPPQHRQQKGCADHLPGSATV